MKCLCLYIILFFCFIQSSTAQTRTANIQYTHRLFTTRDGLPKIQVTCLYQDRDGYMWIGTKGGLARYDGNTFKIYGFEEGLKGGIGSITQLADGRMFICSYRGYYFIDKGKLSKCFTDERFEFYFSNAVVLGNYAYSVLRPKETLYTDNYALVSFHLKTKKLKKVSGFQSVTFLKKINEHVAVAYTKSQKNYCLIFEDGRIIKKKMFLRPLSLSKNTYDSYDIMGDENGTIYKASYSADSLSFQKIAQLRQSISETNIWLHQAKDGSILYFNKDDQLFRHKNDKEEYLTTANIVWAYFEDREGNLWLATEDGLYNFFSFNFKEYNFGFVKNKSDFIWSVAQAKDSIFWLASFNSGLWKYNERTNTTTLEKEIIGVHYHPVIKNDSIYFPGGRDYNIIAKNKFYNIREDGKYTHLFLYNDPVSKNILSGANGILTIDATKSTLYKSSDELGIGKMYVLSMCRDKYKRLWYNASGVIGFIDTNHHVSHFDIKEFGTIISIHCDSRGNLWFAGNRGLWFYDYKR